MGWTVRGSDSGGDEIFRASSDRPRWPPSLLYDGYRVFSPGLKRLERGVGRPLSSSIGVCMVGEIAIPAFSVGLACYETLFTFFSICVCVCVAVVCELIVL